MAKTDRIDPDLESAPRADPDALLKRLEEAEARTQRAKLKIFFGFAPGVGKTYAMLEAARRLSAEGVDVVVGCVETHGRAETQSLVAGLEILPRRAVEHRGVVLPEFDLDAALARKPALLLLDELAHTNAPGVPAREAMAGRPRPARRRHRRPHDVERPARRELERRRRADHDREGARDRARRGARARGRDRADRPFGGGAAHAPARGQGLRSRPGDARAREFLPSRQSLSTCARSRCAARPISWTSTCAPTAKSTASEPRGRHRERIAVGVGPSPSSARLIRAGAPHGGRTARAVDGGVGGTPRPLSQEDAARSNRT